MSVITILLHVSATLTPPPPTFSPIKRLVIYLETRGQRLLQLLGLLLVGDLQGVQEPGASDL